MKAFTPEISWHNKLPALSLDISKSIDETGSLYRIATGGNDCRVYIWLINLKSIATNNPDISIRAGLRRHQRSVGAVRFSSLHMLASGDDDGYIYLWRHKADNQQQLESNVFLNDDEFEDLELWQQHRVLRGHIEDICDLAWSKDGLYLLSGSVDNSAILWDATKGTKIWCSDLIKGYVQGVAIDPHIQFMAAISSDRTLRIYNFSDRRQLYATRRMNVAGKFKAFFCDDTVQTFCRRLEFSPDGQFLIAPTSRLAENEQKQPLIKDSKQSSDGQKTEIELIKLDNSDEEIDYEKIPLEKSLEQDKKKGEIIEVKGNQEDEPHRKLAKTKKPSKAMNVFLVFRRTSFNKPIHYYPTGREVALCARFSPIVYKLRDNITNFWGIPYRIVFAIATSRSILIYDSQQAAPIGYASQIHLARLTDLSWSHDGRLLMISSYDGYSTLLTFGEDEFGEIYTEPLFEPVLKPATVEEEPSKKGQKRSKVAKESASKKEKLDESEPETDDKLKAKLPESATMWRFIIKKN